MLRLQACIVVQYLHKVLARQTLSFSVCMLKSRPCARPAPEAESGPWIRLPRLFLILLKIYSHITKGCLRQEVQAAENIINCHEFCHSGHDRWRCITLLCCVTKLDLLWSSLTKEEVLSSRLVMHSPAWNDGCGSTIQVLCTGGKNVLLKQRHFRFLWLFFKISMTFLNFDGVASDGMRSAYVLNCIWKNKAFLYERLLISWCFSSQKIESRISLLLDSQYHPYTHLLTVLEYASFRDGLDMSELLILRGIFCDSDVEELFLFDCCQKRRLHSRKSFIFT